MFSHYVLFGLKEKRVREKPLKGDEKEYKRSRLCANCFPNARHPNAKQSRMAVLTLKEERGVFDRDNIDDTGGGGGFALQSQF